MGDGCATALREWRDSPRKTHPKSSSSAAPKQHEQQVPCGAGVDGTEQEVVARGGPHSSKGFGSMVGGPSAVEGARTFGGSTSSGNAPPVAGIRAPRWTQ